MKSKAEKYTLNEFIAKCIELGNYDSVRWLEDNETLFVDGVSSSNIQFHCALCSMAAIVCYLDSLGLINREALKNEIKSAGL